MGLLFAGLVRAVKARVGDERAVKMRVGGERQAGPWQFCGLVALVGMAVMGQVAGRGAGCLPLRLLPD